MIAYVGDHDGDDEVHEVRHGYGVIAAQDERKQDHGARGVMSDNASRNGEVGENCAQAHAETVDRCSCCSGWRFQT